ncbi:MAG: hypothetical protein JWP11_3466 [Frankiales bacterium]|nr:hypothetical protein [Frankiales bacterium]
MDIVVIAAAIVAGLLLSRTRALVVTGLVWAGALAMVAWGPAHNSNVHLDSIGFWAPWGVVAVLVAGIVYGCSALRARRDRNVALG